MKTLGSIVFPNAREWRDVDAEPKRCTERPYKPLKNYCFKNKMHKTEKHQKNFTQIQLPATLNLKYPGILSLHNLRESWCSIQSWVFHYVHIGEPPKSWWNCVRKEQWNGCWRPSGDILYILYTVVSTSSFFTITSLPAKLRKVCCLTSSFKTKPALISLYLTTCWKEVAMKLEILKLMGLLIVYYNIRSSSFTGAAGK